jgi:hypothetical protein
MAHGEAMMRHRNTPPLLDAWTAMVSAPEETHVGARRAFTQVLSFESLSPKAYQLKEDVFAWVDGFRPGLMLGDEYQGHDIDRGDGQPWAVVEEIADKMADGVRKLPIKAELEVDGHRYLIHSVVDHVAGPWASAIKWQMDYTFPMFKTSSEHSIALYCLHAVPAFRYLVSDGWKTYEEVYQRTDCRSLAEIVFEFRRGLPAWPELEAVYLEKWVTL